MTSTTFSRPVIQVASKLTVKVKAKELLQYQSTSFLSAESNNPTEKKKGKRKVQGVPQSQTAALPRPQEEEETDKSKQAQTEQTYEKH